MTRFSRVAIMLYQGASVKPRKNFSNVKYAGEINKIRIWAILNLKLNRLWIQIDLV